MHALPATLQALRTHLFNGVIWPDFTRLPDRPAGAGVRSLRHRRRAADRRPPHRGAAGPHTVPAVGFAVLGATTGHGAWVYTGDTGPNPALWQRLKALKVAAW